MPYGQVPLCSSKEIISALERLGCYPGKAKGSSHRSYHRKLPSGRIVSTAVIVGKKEIPRGTLRNILIALDISIDDFLTAR